MMVVRRIGRRPDATTRTGSFDQSGRDLFAVTAFDAFFRSVLTRGGHAGRYTHPCFPNAERSTPAGAYHPPER
jgi:hypothetical protein